MIGRSEWVDRNVASFSHLMEPANRKLAERVGRRLGLAPEGAAALAVRLDASRGDRGPWCPRSTGARPVRVRFADRRRRGRRRLCGSEHHVHMERTHQFRPAEFRFWVALHELTHRAQFQGVPWLREYFLSLVNELVEQSTAEPGRVVPGGRRIDDPQGCRGRRSSTNVVCSACSPHRSNGSSSTRSRR